MGRFVCNEETEINRMIRMGQKVWTFVRHRFPSRSQSLPSDLPPWEWTVNLKLLSRPHDLDSYHFLIERQRLVGSCVACPFGRKLFLCTFSKLSPAQVYDPISGNVSKKLPLGCFNTIHHISDLSTTWFYFTPNKVMVWCFRIHTEAPHLYSTNV